MAGRVIATIDAFVCRSLSGRAQRRVARTRPSLSPALQLLLIVVGSLAGFWLFAQAPVKIHLPRDVELNRSDLLMALWQVEAAAVAFSAAVVVFAVQTYLSSRHAAFGLSASRWVRESWLEHSVAFGFAVIFITGLALVGYSSGDGANRAAVAALALSAIAVLWTAGMLRSALRRVDSTTLNRRRLNRLRSALVAELSRQRVVEESRRLVHELVVAVGGSVVDADDEIGDSSRTPIRVGSQPGRIEEIDRWRLRRAVASAGGGDKGGAVTTTLALDALVRPDEELLAIVPGTRRPPVHTLEDIVRIERRDARPRQHEDVEAMHAEGLAAIDVGDRRWYRSVADCHVETLLLGADLWVEYDRPLAADGRPSSVSLAHVMRNLVLQAKYAQARGQPDLLDELATALERISDGAFAPGDVAHATIATALLADLLDEPELRRDREPFGVRVQAQLFGILSANVVEATMP